MLFFDSIKYVDNEYQFVIGVLYTDTACGDICEGKYYKDNGKVYKTADDLNNRKNPLIDAALDNSLYTYGDYSEEFGNEYIYNFDKIYEKVRNKVNKYEFTFTKENGSFVFKNMKAI